MCQVKYSVVQFALESTQCAGLDLITAPRATVLFLETILHRPSPLFGCFFFYKYHIKFNNANFIFHTYCRSVRKVINEHYLRMRRPSLGGIDWIFFRRLIKWSKCMAGYTRRRRAGGTRGARVVYAPVIGSISRIKRRHRYLSQITYTIVISNRSEMRLRLTSYLHWRFNIDTDWKNYLKR